MAKRVWSMSLVRTSTSSSQSPASGISADSADQWPCPKSTSVEVDRPQVLFGKGQVGRHLLGTATGTPFGVFR